MARGMGGTRQSHPCWLVWAGGTQAIPEQRGVTRGTGEVTLGRGQGAGLLAGAGTTAVCHTQQMLDRQCGAPRFALELEAWAGPCWGNSDVRGPWGP